MSCTKKGSHEYAEYGVFIIRMGDNLWSVYTEMNATGKEIKEGFRTLTAARTWCDAHYELIQNIVEEQTAPRNP